MELSPASSPAGEPSLEVSPDDLSPFVLLEDEELLLSTSLLV